MIKHLVFGKDISLNVSQIVDNVFNEYISVSGSSKPLFAQYCNGIIVTCPGLSQWGSLTLANKGLNPIQILRTYYSSDIEIITTDNIAGITENYPGIDLQEGNKGEDAEVIQKYLSKIRLNYINIPEILNSNGAFGVDTTNSVKAFQKIFNLNEKGIIDKRTWYKIAKVYMNIVRFEELNDEVEKMEIWKVPNMVLSIGHEGEDVFKLQFLLNYVANFYSRVPPVIQSAVFDTMTKNSVIEFQKLFALTTDGIVGKNTWTILYNVYKGIKENIL